jgi:hypothetical protein
MSNSLHQLANRDASRKDRVAFTNQAFPVIPRGCVTHARQAIFQSQ